MFQSSITFLGLVHCRIGSLEKPHSNHNLIVYVHCRIDSQKNSVETAV